MAPILLCQKKLQRTDVTDRLTFPTHGLAAFVLRPGDPGTDFQAFDADNVRWKFRLSIRRGEYKKPVIRKSSWRPFVRTKQLRMGDKVQFFTEQTDDGMKFHVKAQRKLINIFGNGDDYVDVEPLCSTNPYLNFI